MRDKLCKRYQVQKEVARKGCFEGEIALSEMARLGELLHSGPTQQGNRSVTLNFEFVRNDCDTPMLVGQLETSLELECQRCLGSLELPMKLDFRLMIDTGGERLRDSNLDTLHSDDGNIDIIEVVEDELILAIPLVATHADTACNENWPVSEPNPETGTEENPFAVLQQLKTTD